MGKRRRRNEKKKKNRIVSGDAGHGRGEAPAGPVGTDTSSVGHRSGSRRYRQRKRGKITSHKDKGLLKFVYTALILSSNDVKGGRIFNSAISTLIELNGVKCPLERRDRLNSSRFQSNPSETNKYK